MRTIIVPIKNGQQFDKKAIYPKGCFRVVVDYESGGLSEYRYRDGVLHGDNDKPAEVIYNQNGELVIQAWFNNGVIHREGNKIAYFLKIYCEDGSCSIQEQYRCNGLLHRDDGAPAEVWINVENGKYHIWYQEWSRHGKYYRDGDKPCAVWYHENKKLWHLGWTAEAFRESGHPRMIYYNEKGKLHFLGYPNIGSVWFDKDGTISMLSKRITLANWIAKFDSICAEKQFSEEQATEVKAILNWISQQEKALY